LFGANASDYTLRRDAVLKRAEARPVGDLGTVQNSAGFSAGDPSSRGNIIGA